jgi:threonine dehydrogenase-like Zn-dependent dehydrogenase
VMRVRPGGTVVVLGVFTGRPTLPAYRLVNDEVRLVGSVMYGRCGLGSEFGSAVALLPSLKNELERLRSSVLPLQRVNEAFGLAGEKRSGSLKVLVLPNAVV